MKKQTTFYDPENNIRGNCIVTCYANALGLNPDDCPPFEKFFDVLHPDTMFYQDVVNLWFDRLGYKLKTIASDPLEIVGQDAFYFAIGPSERGVNHMVIWKNGKLYHDPHPSDSGIISVKYWEYLERKL